MRTWHLHADGEVVAALEVRESDFPFLYARLVAEPGFERFRPLFAEEVAASDAQDWERADAAYERIRAALTMTDGDGEPVPEFLLHVDGDEAWWRWHHEPFDSED